MTKLTNITKRSNLLFAAAACGLILFAVVMASTLTSQAKSDENPNSPASITPPTRDLSSLTQKFGVFRKPVSAADALGSAGQGLDQPHNGVAIATKLARRIEGVGTRSRMWIAPGTGKVCLLSLEPDAIGAGYSCSSTSESHGVRVSATSPSDIDLAGFVPDGVAEVTVSFKDGTSLKVPVSENVFGVNVSKALSEVSFSGPDGVVTTPLPGTIG